MQTRSCLGQAAGIRVNLTILLNYCGLQLSGRKTFIQCSMKTNSTLTLAEPLCPGPGSVESCSWSSGWANLTFTLRLSLSQSQGVDGAAMWTTAPKVIAAEEHAY